MWTIWMYVSCVTHWLSLPWNVFYKEWTLGFSWVTCYKRDCCNLIWLISERAPSRRRRRVYNSEAQSAVCTIAIWPSIAVKLPLEYYSTSITSLKKKIQYQGISVLKIFVVWNVCQDKSRNDFCCWEHHREPPAYSAAHGSGCKSFEFSISDLDMHDGLWCNFLSYLC